MVDPVPHIEYELAAGTKHPPRFSECPCFVGEEHDPELADDHVEERIGKRQLQCIGLLPLHGTSGPCGGGLIQHGLVQIRRDNRDLWREHLRELAGHDARSRGNLKHT